ncbi:hypothetical protein DKK76_06975, partial [Frischella perrara]
MAGITAAEAEKKLSGIKDAEGLRNLINQLDVSTHGSKTVLYSGMVNGERSTKIINALQKDPNYRVIDNTEAAKFLSTADKYGSPLNRKLNSLFGTTHSKKLSSQSIEFLFGSQQNEVRQNNGAWDTVSKKFVSGASGNVEVIGHMDPNRVFAQTELPALMKNPNVHSVNGIDKSILRSLENNGLEHIRNVSAMKAAMSELSPDKTKAWKNFKPNGDSYKLYNDYYNKLDPTAKKSLDKTAQLLAHSPINKLARHIPLVGYIATGVGLYAASASAQAAMDRGDINEAKGILYEWGVKEVSGTILSTLAGAAAASVAATAGAPALAVAAIGLGVGIAAGILSDALIDEMAHLLRDNDNNGTIDLWDKLKNLLNDAGNAILAPLSSLFPSLPDGAKTTSSPIILDLDRDGVETISKNNNIHFDLNANQFAENTGWVGSDDGLLVLDLNNNGIIDNGR